MKYNFNFSLADTTPYGNIYFSRIFDIQGKVREEWLKQNNLLSSLTNYQLITKKAHNDFIKECKPFVAMEAEFKVTKINKASFEFYLIVRNKETQETHSIGWQKICFAKNGKLIAIPKDFVNHLMLKRQVL